MADTCRSHDWDIYSIEGPESPLIWNSAWFCDGILWSIVRSDSAAQEYSRYGFPYQQTTQAVPCPPARNCSRCIQKKLEAILKNIREEPGPQWMPYSPIRMDRL